MPVPPSATRYWELRVPTSAEVGEGLTNFLWELGALGVAEEDLGESACLRAFYPATADPAGLGAAVRRYVEALRALGLEAGGTPAVVALADERWGEAWREHFRPLAVGDRLLVAPPWERAAGGGRQVVVIEPGRAFGTGHHATTRGCLEALEAVVAPGPVSRALDLGTGSGILAVSAALLGVAHVLALDVDPDAVAAATANAEQNGVGERVRCLLGDAGDATLEPAHLVLANLLTAAHLRLAARYPALVAPGGTLVLGGILEREADEVAAAIVRHGFVSAAARSSDDWTTLRFVRASGTVAVPAVRPAARTPRPASATPDAGARSRRCARGAAGRS